MRISTKHWVAPLLLVAGMIACWLAYRLAAPRQPVYKGKPLAYWLDWLPMTVDTANGHARMWPGAVPAGPAQQKAFLDRLNDLSGKAQMAAYRAGTNGMPLLLKRLQARESKMDQMLQKLKARMKLPWPESKEVRRWKAVTAMIELHGSIDFSPIVPQLIRMSQDTDPQVKKAALFLLRYIKPRFPAQPEDAKAVPPETN
ncbi:MAG: hypothetical protein HY735_12830 [Verrucomicrobia bacterium]|nr:hypothetical protein [Verrucomicrobiota bacterium]